MSLFYEKRLHKEVSDVWSERCRVQINGALAELETSRRKRSGDAWFGNVIGHADIAIACALRFIPEAHPGLIAMADFPALGEDAARLEALPVFQTIAQKFIRGMSVRLPDVKPRCFADRAHATPHGHVRTSFSSRHRNRAPHLPPWHVRAAPPQRDGPQPFPT